MEKIRIEFADTTNTIDVILFSKNEIDSLKHQTTLLYKSDRSKEYNCDIYETSDSKIICELKMPFYSGVMVNSIEDFHIIRTRATIFKLSEESTPFYLTEYREKKTIDMILKKYNGIEVKKYTNRQETIYRLSNGKCFYIESIKLGDYEIISGDLYNSFEDIEKIGILSRVLERKDD